MGSFLVFKRGGVSDSVSRGLGQLSWRWGVTGGGEFSPW